MADVNLITTLTKNLTEYEAILYAHHFEDVEDWFTNLMSANCQQYVDECYECAKQDLLDAGHELVPADKQACIMMAWNEGVLKLGAERLSIPEEERIENINTDQTEEQSSEESNSGE
jgi:hypothetical protein|tara:strand:+ start:424 stop:774 length:351 start_codon:yes stop_codon:yes gene_type:complete